MHECTFFDRLHFVTRVVKLTLEKCHGIFLILRKFHTELLLHHDNFILTYRDDIKVS